MNHSRTDLAFGPDALRTSIRLAVLVSMVVLLATCTTRRVDSSREMAAVAPQLTVERFLQAANARDLEAMGRLFGTPDGPVGDTGSPLGCAFKKIGSWFGFSDPCITRSEVELRLDAIAQILRHEDYRIVSESSVPGRAHPTTRVGVDLVQRGRRVTDVPFVVVRSDEGSWLVQEIGLDRMTAG